MTAPFEIKGRRGVLELYFEGDDLAIDITEYGKNPLSGLPPCAETFLTYQQIGELIEGLRNMRQHLVERKSRRAQEAAQRLAGAGVTPRDPDELTAQVLRHDADLMESVALFYLNEVTDARAPIYPF